MSINQLVLTYGFECENIILFTCKSNICKSFVTGNPVYSSIMIKDTNIKSIINKMKKIENNHEFYLSFIALLITKNTWAELKNYSKDCVCLVFASGTYNTSEYIRNKKLYL